MAKSLGKMRKAHWRETGLTHIKDLVPDPANRRAHNPRNIGMVVDALQAVGAARSIVIDEDNVVLAGNGVVEAAAEAGITKVQMVEADGSTLVAVRRKGLTAEQKRALAIYDNRTGELATWDFEQLQADKDAGLSLQPFWTQEEEANLLAKPSPKAGLTDPDEVPPERPTSIEVGDLFELGAHRLLCGDSTAQDDVTRLMGSARAHLCFTSPPYAQQRKQEYGGVHTDDYIQWFGLVQVGVRRALSEDATFLVNIHPHCENGERHLYVYGLILSMQREWGWRFIDQCVWINDGIPGAQGLRLKDSWESVWQFAVGQPWSDTKAVGHQTERLARYAAKNLNHSASGNAGLSGADMESGVSAGRNVVYVSNRTVPNAVGHPAVFPVPLADYFICAYCPVGGLVYEPFAGSGSALIAADQAGKRCYGLELKPSYCQVIIDRWEAFTGQKAQKVGEAVRA